MAIRRNGHKPSKIGIKLHICPHMFMPFSCGTNDSDYSISDSREPDFKTVSISLHWYYTLYMLVLLAPVFATWPKIPSNQPSCRCWIKHYVSSKEVNNIYGYLLKLLGKNKGKQDLMSPFYIFLDPWYATDQMMIHHSPLIAHTRRDSTDNYEVSMMSMLITFLKIME
jgi:hypothetical protein